MLALLKDINSVMDYHTTVMNFAQWCEDNHLNLNISQTKELIARPPSPQHPIVIHDQTVGIVDNLKYFGVTTHLPLIKTLWTFRKEVELRGKGEQGNRGTGAKGNRGTGEQGQQGNKGK